MADTYVVKSGDTLWSIAKTYLGAGSKYQELAKWNNISNPNYITVGQVLKLTKTASSTTTHKANSKTVTIKQFGLVSNTENTLYVSWEWTRDNTDCYKYKWYYHTGDMWFVGEDSSTTYKYSTYSIPSNAKKVMVKIKPIAKKRKVDDKETPYWNDSEWTEGKKETFVISSMIPPATPPAPNVEDSTKYQLIAKIENIDLDPINTPTHIKFRVIKNNTSTYNTGTAKINKNYKFVTYTCNLEAGYEYYVQCKAIRGKLESDEWSDHSSIITTPPATPGGFTTCRADSETSVYLEWKSVRSATGYEIQYTTEKDHFDKSDDVQSKTVENTTSYYIEGLESGKEYFFRLRATNDSEDRSPWSKISSVIIGSKPAAPTTWSSTTTAVAGEPLTLNWIHNSVDGSSQTYAKLEYTVTVGNKSTTVTLDIPNNRDDDEKDKMSSYSFDTSNYSEGTTLEWRVQTRGVTSEYSDFSDHRTVDIYAPPTLDLNIMDKIQNGNVLETVTTFPIYVSGEMGAGATQKPIAYHITISPNETYETVDDLGNVQFVNEGDNVYSKYFDVVETYDITKPIVVELSAGDIDLENGVSYTVRGVVSMDSGLTAEATTEFSVSWTDEVLTPNGEVGIDEDTLTAHIRPYCMDYKTSIHEVSLSSGVYTVTDTVLDENTINSVYTTTDEEVLLGVTTNGTQIYYCAVYTDAAGNFIDPVYYTVTRSSNTFTKTSSTVKPSSLTSVVTKTGEEVLLGVKGTNTYIYYSIIDESEIVENVTLSVYRREFDGGFVELATGIDNASNTFITDPHPALDYARYRIVARSETTGAVGYYDLPGVPVGGKSIVIQWDEDWSSFDTPDTGVLAEPAWAGSILKLHYNIDVSSNSNQDVELVEYTGRSHPVAYYGTQVGQTDSWNVDVEKDDEETLYALRRLQRWMGNVYVREPSGSGYWANISVSFSLNHCELTIPVTINVTRVEGGA